MPGWPKYSEEEIKSVTDILQSGCVNYWNGNEGRTFETEFADYCGVPYAIAVANGTLALELALYALGIGANDEVIVTPRTYVASASSIVMRGARPVFADIDPISQNITAETIKAVLTPKARAIMAVHLAGWPCEMDKIMELARQYDLKVVEDCAQAHGAQYNYQRVGSFGDVAAFSFCTDKVISTGGEGGMLLCRDEDVWRRAWSYKDHGKAWDAVYNCNNSLGFRWVHESFGTNWRLTEMQSAIGRIQLRKLTGWLKIRKRNAAILYEYLSRLDCLRVPWPPAHVEHAFYKFYVFIRLDCLKDNWSRDSIMQNIQKCGVWCQQGSCPEVYMERAFENTGWRPVKRLPVAQELGETSLMFLVDPTHTEGDMKYAAQCIVNVLARACTN